MGNELAWRNVKWLKIGQDQRCADTFTTMTKRELRNMSKTALKISKIP
jgi:hypothetical protein